MGVDDSCTVRLSTKKITTSHALNWRTDVCSPELDLTAIFIKPKVLVFTRSKTDRNEIPTAITQICLRDVSSRRNYHGQSPTSTDARWRPPNRKWFYPTLDERDKSDSHCYLWCKGGSFRWTRQSTRCEYLITWKAGHECSNSTAAMLCFEVGEVVSKRWTT
jgi:hypothetical protein